jgi:hypothetical protein
VVVVGVVVVVVVGWVGVVVVVVAGVVVVVVGLEVVVGVVVVWELTGWHCVAAPELTVAAPSLRFWRRVPLSVPGRLATSATSSCAAAWAAPQRPAVNALETWLSLLFSVFA